ncbi:hypothetical protein [endosymbiont GvMRE of Glomus versiforme]|uniref:hypothetical protein n=1 Tax=endosymbiont GvMRE of Glomus versiforme TaxID=2039283 RepID=UPI000EDBA0B8|nr:hypothetical protein [endosymbiont GvMRE of Glomus versiforme]RHZ36233.1 hypothetical protein GvMRE_Ic2g144 [endosymbiont GvMRE of Glomus versiforme]
MKEKLTNCFYCQNLKNLLLVSKGKCAFCGVFNNPLYLIAYQSQPTFFCCGCAWWQFPHSEAEKQAENQWYQARKSKK